MDISGNDYYSAQTITKSPKRSSEISPSHSPSANSQSSKEDEYEDDEMSYETEEGQNGSPACSNHNEHDGNAMHLLGSDESIHTISTSAAIEAVQVFDSDESLANILQTTMKTSENIDGLCMKASETESSEINTSTLSNSLTTNSEDMQTALQQKEIDIAEASVKSSMNVSEDTMKLTEVEPIPPKGSVMVDFKQNPLTISINVGPQDSVTAKLKHISTLANEYANTPKLAQDLLKADGVSVDYKKHGNLVGIQQICAEISNVSEVHTNSAQGGGGTDFYQSSTAVINTTLKCPTDFSKAEASMSDEDLLDHGDTGVPLEDLDFDEENRLLQSTSPTEEMLKDVKVASSNTKCKMDSEDDESGNKLFNKKRRRRTLRVKVKNTGGAANFGKSARLPTFSRLSRSILHKKQKGVSSNSSASSSSSDPYDEDTATEDNNSQSHITISDEHASDVEGNRK